MVHQHGSLLVVNLGVNASVADKVHNPFLALVLVETETGGEVPRQKNEVSSYTPRAIL